MTTFLPGQRVRLKKPNPDELGPWGKFEVLEPRGPRVLVRTTHPCWQVPGSIIPCDVFQADELELDPDPHTQEVHP